MAQVIKTTFQLRRGTKAVWEKNNPILASGEPGFVIDKNLLKIGDGVTPWNQLPYIAGQEQAQIENSGVFNANTKDEFPSEGKPEIIYKALKEKKIYQWNPELNTYEELNQSTVIESYDDRDPYEVFSMPKDTLVSIKESEIRIMCPKDTNWDFQSSGEEADKNSYYIGLKIYAPNDSIHSFKEDLNKIIQDQTMYYFENNEFAGIDDQGRKFSIVWLPVAHYNVEKKEWEYYGKNSSEEKYIGWYYSVEWYNAEGLNIATNSIRINLSNENCHNNIEPYYMGAINVNKLVQNQGEFLTIYGGSASDNI